MDEEGVVGGGGSGGNSSGTGAAPWRVNRVVPGESGAASLAGSTESPREGSGHPATRTALAVADPAGLASDPDGWFSRGPCVSSGRWSVLVPGAAASGRGAAVVRLIVGGGVGGGGSGGSSAGTGAAPCSVDRVVPGEAGAASPTGSTESPREGSGSPATRTALAVADPAGVASDPDSCCSLGPCVSSSRH